MCIAFSLTSQLSIHFSLPTWYLFHFFNFFLILLSILFSIQGDLENVDRLWQQMLQQGVKPQAGVYMATSKAHHGTPRHRHRTSGQFSLLVPMPSCRTLQQSATRSYEKSRSSNEEQVENWWLPCTNWWLVKSTMELVPTGEFVVCVTRLAHQDWVAAGGATDRHVVSALRNALEGARKDGVISKEHQLIQLSQSLGASDIGDASFLVMANQVTKISWSELVVKDQLSSTGDQQSFHDFFIKDPFEKLWEPGAAKLKSADSQHHDHETHHDNVINFNFIGFKHCNSNHSPSSDTSSQKFDGKE